MKTVSSGSKVLETVRRLVGAVKELEELYPGRRFTMDGHLVGSIGEVLAAELYRLVLLPGSSQCHDATCPKGRNVQIKLTQGKRVSIYSEPDYLLVLRLDRTFSVAEIYNGPGHPAWSAAGRIQKNGQRGITLGRLGALMQAVPHDQMIELDQCPTWFHRPKRINPVP